MRLVPALLTLANAWTGMRSSYALVADEQAMTVEQAVKAVEARVALPEDIQRALRQKGALRKNKQGFKEEFDAAFLEKAHAILNQMYETEQSELDVLHEDCQDFTEHVRAELSLNRATSAALAAESSFARAANQRAQLVINTAVHDLEKTQDTLRGTQDTLKSATTEAASAYRERDAAAAATSVVPSAGGAEEASPPRAPWCPGSTSV